MYVLYTYWPQTRLRLSHLWMEARSFGSVAIYCVIRYKLRQQQRPAVWLSSLRLWDHNTSTNSKDKTRAVCNNELVDMQEYLVSSRTGYCVDVHFINGDFLIASLSSLSVFLKCFQDNSKTQSWPCGNHEDNLILYLFPFKIDLVWWKIPL